ncbi:MAG: amidohydrolase [Pirellulaceae bacterium]|jgi:predicted TIM-barrel fold metal-dependent hydrolase|nr:amidohydrolase [Pirellulaceae bacterium]
MNGLAGKTLDIHVHLFGAGDAGSGCRLSKATSGGQSFKHLAEQLRLRERAKSIDQAYLLALVEQVEESTLDKAVVLAQDAVYDDRGKPDWEKTHFYVPNDYLLEVAARHPARMIPCVSINPQRADAIDELDRCAAKGARLLKIHPPTQGVDLSDRKRAAFFRRCAELRVIVMVHTGHEHTAPVLDIGLADPRKLELALDSGCTIVACHCATGWQTDSPDMLPGFLAMVRKYGNLWGDTAVLGSAGRTGDFQRLLADEEAGARLLHGSDFPFPAFPLAFESLLGAANASRLQAIENSMDQDLALKEALGIGLASAERAYRLVCGEAAR